MFEVPFVVRSGGRPFFNFARSPADSCALLVWARDTSELGNRVRVWVDTDSFDPVTAEGDAGHPTTPDLPGDNSVFHQAQRGWPLASGGRGDV